MAEIERVGFAGLGIMGGPMARNLREAGFELSVYTRTHEKAERFAAEHGARAAATPAEAAEGADAFITMVPDAPQVEEVLSGALETLPESALVVDMSTTSPTASRAIAERVAPRDFVEAPVSGSKPKAEDGTLTIFAGGEPRSTRPPAVPRDGRADRPRGSARPRPDGQAAHEHDGRRQRRGAGRGRAAPPRPPASTRTPSSRSPPAALGPARCST